MTTRQQKRSRSHDAGIEELLRGNPVLSAEYLDQSLREGTREEMLFAMRRVVRAHGGIAKIASETGLNENTLHRTLSPKGNPRLSTLLTICGAVGMQISISPAQPLPASAYTPPPDPAKRAGFLRGRLEVSKDFDTMGKEEIQAMFEGAK